MILVFLLYGYYKGRFYSPHNSSQIHLLVGNREYFDLFLLSQSPNFIWPGYAFGNLKQYINNYRGVLLFVNAELISNGSCTIDVTSSIIRIDLITLQSNEKRKPEQLIAEINQQLIMPLENVLRANMLGLSTAYVKSQHKPIPIIH